MTTPKPGQRARGTKTGRSVMVLLDLMGRRMALRVLWELHRAGKPMTFRALQAAADTNPSLLNTRLKELRDSMLVAHVGDGYVLSPLGAQLVQLISPVVVWSDEWATAVQKHVAPKDT